MDNRLAREVLAGRAEIADAGRGVQPATALAVALLKAAGTDSHPRRDDVARAAGPWTAVGAWHSHTMAVLRADACGLTEVSYSRADDDPASWLPRWTPRRVDEAVKAALRSGMSPGIDFNQTSAAARAAKASVWWLYADAISPSNDPEAIGADLARLLDAPAQSSISVGNFAAALNVVGDIVGDGPVHLVWSGNRMCRPDDLTPREASVLAARRARLEN